MKSFGNWHKKIKLHKKVLTETAKTDHKPMTSGEINLNIITTNFKKHVTIFLYLCPVVAEWSQDEKVRNSTQPSDLNSIKIVDANSYLSKNW